MPEIIDLGTSDDLNMQMGAFGPPVQETVLKAFNDNPQKKREVAMSGLNLQPREKMVAYQSKVQAFRKEVQLAEVESGSLTDKRRPAVAANSNVSSCHLSSSRNDNCRVCKEVEKQGNTQHLSLFENHSGEGIYQCPVFMKFKIKERIQIAAKAKLCQFCLDSKIFSDRQHERTCKDNKPQYSDAWKCASPGCGRHSWICSTHADNSNKKN